MTATAEKIPQAAPSRPSIEAHEAALAGWQAKVQSLGRQMDEAQGRLDALEVEAAQAALAGEELPDMGGLESKVRALRKARVMAQEQAEAADEELAAARRQEAAEAAAATAAELVKEAAGLDDCLSELGHRLASLTKLGRRYEKLAQAGGLRRRGVDPVGPSALAGAIFHAAPEIFEALRTPRPSLDQRQPLAAYLARRHGVGPQLVEVMK